MKALLATTALLLLATPAFAVNDDINSNNVNSGSFVGIGGNANGAVINNGAGSGTTSLAGGSVSNSGNSSATGGTVSNSGNSLATGGIGIGGNQSQSATGGNQSQSATTGSQSVNVEARKRNPVSTAYSAPLVAAEDACMGSSSVGAQGIGLGLSVGSTWHDDDCVRRKDARELHNMGLKPAAIALMCLNANVRKAMAAAGTDCPEIEAEEEGYVPAYPTNADSAKH